MGIGVNNNTIRIHMPHGGVPDYTLNYHRGDQGIDSDSPAFDKVAYLNLKSAATQIQFAARVQAISAAMNVWWDGLPSEVRADLYTVVTAHA